jgi:hypothetical protein
MFFDAKCLTFAATGFTRNTFEPNINPSCAF